MLKDQPLGGLHEITGHINDRSAKMHQRGHTYYGTDCPEFCDAAAKWAARRLITPRALLNAARDETCTYTIATALSVTQSDVLNYLADLDVDEWLILQRLIGHELR
jgi:hypothetical protein